MTEDNTLLIVAVLAVIASLAAAGFSYYSLSQGPTVKGFAVSYGSANLSVESSMEINFTTTSINWGSGKVDSGRAYAILDSEGTKVWGNWTTVNSPLVLANIGNQNVSISLTSGKTNATFLGGTDPSYRWKVTEKESGSCGGQSGAYGSYVEVNTTTGGTRFCNQFGYLTAANELNININITIPYNSQTGPLSDVITATSSTAI